jgi:ubiquinone/menaquinone biosynthesis C-methylase UbiE
MIWKTLGIAAIVLGGALPFLRRASQRRFEREIDRLVELLGIGPGSVVADLGAGKGPYAVALAQRVGPSGHVYALEVDAGRRVQIEAAARRAGVLGQLTVVAAHQEDPGLPSDSCDAVFLRGSYHHLTQPERTLQGVQRALKPGGRFAVIDFSPTLWLAPWTPQGLPADRTGHGIDPDIVVREVAAAGFQKTRWLERWPSGANLLVPHYGLAFVRP